MRATADEAFMAMAFVVATRGSCPRRQVGCVLVDQNNFVLATGYNGAPRGAPHCIDHPCAGVKLPHGSGLELCEAIHAEQNALLQCRDVMSVATCYTTDFTCPHCFKMLCNTGCRRIVFYKRYPASEEVVVTLNNRLKQPMEIEPYGGISAGLVQPKGDLATAIYRGFA